MFQHWFFMSMVWLQGGAVRFSSEASFKHALLHRGIRSCSQRIEGATDLPESWRVTVDEHKCGKGFACRHHFAATVHTWSWVSTSLRRRSLAASQVAAALPAGELQQVFLHVCGLPKHFLCVVCGHFWVFNAAGCGCIAVAFCCAAGHSQSSGLRFFPCKDIGEKRDAAKECCASRVCTAPSVSQPHSI